MKTVVFDKFFDDVCQRIEGSGMRLKGDQAKLVEEKGKKNERHLGS